MHRPKPRLLPTNPVTSRARIFQACLYFIILGIVSRLFYWQVIKSAHLEAAADDQYERTIKEQGIRGVIATSDGFALVSNQQVYRLYGEPKQLVETPEHIANVLAPLLLEEDQAYLRASESAVQRELSENLQKNIEEKLSEKDKSWVNLRSKISLDLQKKIDELDIHGIGFDPYVVRQYPEASMAAHITGFVGKDNDGNDVGYFGLEGQLEKELQARKSEHTIFTDARGFQLPGLQGSESTAKDGREITLSIRRDVQHLIETELLNGIEKYQAVSGEIIVMEPTTGRVLALAAFPNYDQATFSEFAPDLYKNPALASLYEPGSTFKVLTLAAAVDAGVVKPDTTCTNCDGPRVFGKYTIKTWNEEYHPDITMTDALAKSDNIAMIFASELLGADRFKDYLHKFGIGQQVGVELQEDQDTPFPSKWGPVELATTSFGQGISANSFQIIKAISAIANGGALMKTTIIQSVQDSHSIAPIPNEPVVERQVISKESSEQVTTMMIAAAEKGEAQWIASKTTHTVAGKTGTSQIAEDGAYSSDKTIASFIGFAPVRKPAFIMLVKLREPQSSPWAAETAAPLWYKIAQKLYVLLEIPPDKLR